MAENAGKAPASEHGGGVLALGLHELHPGLDLFGFGGKELAARRNISGDESTIVTEYPSRAGEGQGLVAGTTADIGQLHGGGGRWRLRLLSITWVRTCPRSVP